MSEKKELTLFSEKYLPKVNDLMLDFLKRETEEPVLLEAMAYSIHAGGKRIRPLLLLAVIDFLGQPLTTAAFQTAASLEMIHTYSLIHDDLPAMDNDDLRRGQPTNHIVFGEAIAILAGDGLLTEAFHLMSQLEAVDLSIQVKLIKLLAAAAGTKGMIAGQAADIQGEEQKLPLAELQFVHARKTGALITYAVEAGLLLSGAGVEESTALLTFAKHLGIAFQIRDDLLDVLGDTAALGKNTGMDALLQKSTYPSLLGIEGAKQAFEDQWQQAWDALQPFKLSKEATILEQILFDLKKIK